MSIRSYSLQRGIRSLLTVNVNDNVTENLVTGVGWKSIHVLATSGYKAMQGHVGYTIMAGFILGRTIQVMKHLTLSMIYHFS